MKKHRKRDAERERKLEDALYQIGRIQEMARADGAALLVVLIPLARFRGHPGCLHLNDTHLDPGGLDLLSSTIQDKMHGAWPAPRRHVTADAH